MFPKCFYLRADYRRPLKLGIRADLAPLVPFAEEELMAALGHYARGDWYLRACVEGAPRIDLEGKVVGTVTTQEATFAHEILAHRERWKIKKQQAAQGQSATARPIQRKAPGTPSNGERQSDPRKRQEAKALEASVKAAAQITPANVEQWLKKRDGFSALKEAAARRRQAAA